MAFHRARRPRVPAAAAVLATGVVTAFVMAMSLSPARAQEPPPAKEQPKIEIESAHPSEGSIRYIVRKAEGERTEPAPAPDRKVTGTAISPDGTAQAGIEFKPMGDGRYEGTVEIPKEQSWRVRFESPQGPATPGEQPGDHNAAAPEESAAAAPADSSDQPKPEGSKPDEAKPDEVKPEEQKSEDPKPAESQPADQAEPEEPKSADDEQSDEENAADAPAKSEQPAEQQPANEQLADDADAPEQSTTTTTAAPAHPTAQKVPDAAGGANKGAPPGGGAPDGAAMGLLGLPLAMGVGLRRLLRQQRAHSTDH